MSRLQWLQLGDSNTKFFHTVTNNRRRKKIIFSLEINNQLEFEPYIIQQHVASYFKNLLGTSESRLLKLNPILWQNTSFKLTLEQANSLELSFTKQEIRNVVFQSNSSKSPGPDGMSFLFYQ